MSDSKVTPTLLLSVAALLAGVGIFYHYVVTVPQQARAKQEMEQERVRQEEAKLRQADQERARAKIDLEVCLAGTDLDYSRNWDSTCEALGLPKDCRLPSQSAQRWDTLHRQAKDECYKKYPSR